MYYRLLPHAHALVELSTGIVVLSTDEAPSGQLLTGLRRATSLHLEIYAGSLLTSSANLDIMVPSKQRTEEGKR